MDDDHDDPMIAQECRAALSRIAHQKARDQLAEAELLDGRIARIRWVLKSEKASPAAVEAFVCWIRERPIERRELVLERALEFLERIRGALGPYLRDGMMDRCIGQAIIGTPDSFLRWVDGMRAHEHSIQQIVKALELAMTPEPVVAHLISWVFSNGAIDPDRLAALETFSERLDAQAFSDEARARCWRTFLASAGSDTSLEWDDVRRWIDGLERPVERTEG